MNGRRYVGNASNIKMFRESVDHCRGGSFVLALFAALVDLHRVLAVRAGADAGAGFAQILGLLGAVAADAGHATLDRGADVAHTQATVAARVLQVEPGLRHEPVARHRVARAATGLRPEAAFGTRFVEPAAREGACAHHVGLAGGGEQVAALAVDGTGHAAHKTAAVAVGRTQRAALATLERSRQVTVKVVGQRHLRASVKGGRGGKGRNYCKVLR